MNQDKTIVTITILSACILITGGCTCNCGNQKNNEYADLFNARDLSGWMVTIKDKGNVPVEQQDLFAVQNGIVHVYPNAEKGSVQPYAGLITEKEYSHYHFSFEYKWGQRKFYKDPDAIPNSGLLYHVIEPEVIWPVSVESQMKQNNAGDIVAIRSRVSTTQHPQTQLFAEPADGGVMVTDGKKDGYTRYEKKEPAENPVGQWNTMEIIVHGDNAVHIVNGKVVNKVYDAKYWDNDAGQWKPLTRGKILIQAEGAEMFYRNMKIRQLTEK